ncbi:hypothetical protein MML48_2g00012139 [Holotrichia oblita]|uniref:Uncharacterized protein n=1 Tax=Holotrichia oblita TaxID=644536 RepID=A0ACB9TK99_HOLOL|nr:hypothetical protein MML48_2g00012139 [Holotrichia oblita]
MALISDKLLNPIIKKRIDLTLHNKNVKDIEISITPAIIENPNILSLIWDVRVTGKSTENSGIIEHDWILKSATLNEVVRKYAQVDRLFKKGDLRLRQNNPSILPID